MYRKTIAVGLACLLLLGGCSGQTNHDAEADASDLVEQTTDHTEPLVSDPVEQASGDMNALETEPTEAPSQDEEEDTPGDLLLRSILPVDFAFSSGAGAWATGLTLYPDGSFEGSYYDSDMGDTGEGYPYGTQYLCSFSGRFENIQQVDEYSFTMELEELTSDYDEDASWIEDGVLYISSVPYGIEEGTKFVLYLPETPVAALDEEFLSWWPGRWSLDGTGDTLGFYGIWNVEMGYGFFG
jgi:hypothetical protein